MLASSTHLAIRRGLRASRQAVVKMPTASFITPRAMTATPSALQSRSFHADPMTGEQTGHKDLDSSALVVEMTKNPKQPPPASTLVFGHSFSDHMLTVKWNSASGWSAPHIHPYGPFVLDPSSVIFHYAPSCFEGMKAYKDDQGRVRLFRPDMNMARLNRTSARIALPTFDGKEFTKLLAKLCSIDSSFVPSEPGHSIYIRPTMIGTQPALGVHPTNEATLFAILSPVGPYFKSGFKPVSLMADPSHVRAWPRGTGKYKLGGNYAPTIQPQMDAAKKGYSQVLWLYGEDDLLTEVGTMNLFIALKNKQGQVELVTPPLNDIILPGVTRDSILTLARDHVSGKMRIDGVPNDMLVSERDISMKEIEEASKEGRLVEMFGSGTAVVVSPVDRIGYKGRDIHVPAGEEGIGSIAKGMLKTITDIQLGKIDHPWSVVVDDLL